MATCFTTCLPERPRDLQSGLTLDRVCRAQPPMSSRAATGVRRVPTVVSAPADPNRRLRLSAVTISETLEHQGTRQVRMSLGLAARSEDGHGDGGKP